MSRQGKNIYQRKDGRWEGRYIKGRIDGKIMYGYVFGKSYEEAEEKLRQFSADVASPAPKPCTDTFSSVSEEWLSLQKPQLKTSSIAKYTNILNLYLLPTYGEQGIDAITRNDLMMYSGELLSSGGAKKDGLAPKTINSILSVMKNVFDYAIKEKGLDLPDIRDISVKQPQKPLRVFSRTEQDALNQYLFADLTPCHIGILLCLYTGLRIGEICALKWEDVYLNEHYIYVHKSMQRVQTLDGSEKKTKIKIDTPKSDCSIRRIPLPKEIHAKIAPYQKQADAFVLTGMVHSFVEPRTMENHFKAVVRECNIEDANFHALRHTFATRCVELGFDIKSLSEILGHASVSITLDRYVHPSMDLKQQNMNKLSELMVTN